MEINVWRRAITINVTSWWEAIVPLKPSLLLPGKRTLILLLAQVWPPHPRPPITPARSRRQPLLPADTRRACALLPHVGSGRQRALLSSGTESPSVRGACHQLCSLRRPAVALLSPSSPHSAQRHGQEPDEALQATSVLSYGRLSGRGGSGGERD